MQDAFLFFRRPIQQCCFVRAWLCGSWPYLHPLLDAAMWVRRFRCCVPYPGAWDESYTVWCQCEPFGVIYFNFFSHLMENPRHGKQQRARAGAKKPPRRVAKLGEIFPPSYFSVNANIGTVVAVCVFDLVQIPASFITAKLVNRCCGRAMRLSWRRANTREDPDLMAGLELA